MKKISAYKTSDGKIFEDDIKAEAHQLDIIGILLDTLVIDVGGNYTRIDRHKTLLATMENKDFKTIINKLYSAINYTD